MRIDRFEDIEAWKESRKMVQKLYACFSDCRDYCLRDQILRAAISVMANIAEGFERNSSKEFIHFLTISRGSLAEVKSLLYIAKDVGYIDESVFSQFNDGYLKINGLLNGFISYLKKGKRGDN